MPNQEQKLKRFFNTPPPEADAEFEYWFERFVQENELEDITREKDHWRERYIELLEKHDQPLEKMALEAKSRVPSLSDEPPDNAPKKNKGGRPPERDSYNANVYRAVEVMAIQQSCSIRKAQKFVARYSDTDDGVSPGKKRTFPAIETAYKRGNQ